MVSYLAVFEILRALCAGKDVIERIVFARARLVVESSTVDKLLVGDPHGVGRGRGTGPGRRVLDGGDSREEDVCLRAVREGLGLGRRDAHVGVEVVDGVASMSLCDLLPWFALRHSVTGW
jgi:hypothetical protein